MVRISDIIDLNEESCQCCNRSLAELERLGIEWQWIYDWCYDYRCKQCWDDPAKANQKPDFVTWHDPYIRN